MGLDIVDTFQMDRAGVAGPPTGAAGGGLSGTYPNPTVATNANLTGPITSTGNATAVASQTGTGTKFVMDTSPTLVTPVLGVASATTVNKVALTAPTTGSTLTVADGKTLTASNTLTLTGTDSSSVAFGTGGTIGGVGYAATGQVPGTATNDSATAGNVGEYVAATSNNSTATVTITIASPAVISWTAHGLTAGTGISFTTTGALPTGLTAGTGVYFVIPTGLTANTFEISATPFGAAVNTSGSQSGTHSGFSSITAASSGVWFNVNAIQLTAGDWDIFGAIHFGAAGTSASSWSASLSGTSATVSTLSDTISGSNGPSDVRASAVLSSVENLAAGRGRALLSGTTTIYLVGSVTYTGGAPAVWGYISARRMR